MQVFIQLSCILDEPSNNSSPKNDEKVTKLKRKHESPQRPESVLSRTPSIIFSQGDDDLDDLDDFQPLKKSKVDPSMTFPIGEDNPVTSTQIEPTLNGSPGTIKVTKELTLVRTPPGLSAKTLSKLQLFSAPKLDEEENEEVDTNREECKAIESSSAAEMSSPDSSFSKMDFSPGPWSSEKAK
jgi:hypothetical protein